MSDSMAGRGRGFRFWRKLSALAGCGGKTCVYLLQILLQLLLDLHFQGCELDAHSDPGIAGTHDAFGDEFLRINPESDDYFGADHERDQALNVAAAPANIRRIALHVRAAAIFKADGDREQNLVPHEPSFFRSAALRTFCRRIVLARNLGPGHDLTSEYLNSKLESPWRGSRFYPFDMKARLLIAVLDPDNFALFQRVVNARQQGSFTA